MKKIIFLVSLLFLVSCEQYVLPNSDLSLSGKYVVSRLEITSVDQNQNPDSIYLLGTTYLNSILPDPFDTITINRFYLHFDYSTLRMKLLGVDNFGRDIWYYGNPSDRIFYSVLNNNAYDYGHLQFDYVTNDGSSRRLTFHIEHDGLESLQLKSTGSWFRGKFGEKQVMTLYLVRLGP